MATPIISPRRVEEFFNPDGTFTLRALRFFESLTEGTNESTQIIEESISNLTFTIYNQVINLQQRIGSGQKVTIDTTGFTVDTTLQTADQTEA